MSNKKQKLTFVQGLKAQFSTKSLVLIPIAVGINLIGGTLASTLKLPLFLDMIGTILSAALAGPWVAALVGFLTNIFLALVSNPIYVPYSLVSIAAGLIIFVRCDFFLHYHFCFWRGNWGNGYIGTDRGPDCSNKGYC